MNADSKQSAEYRWLVRTAVVFGAVTFVAGGLWLVGGAGMYGSPVAGAFQVDRLTGYPNYWEFSILWVVVAGPMALLPCVLLERLFPRAGAIAMIIAAIFAAEAGIRSGRNYWGYAGVDALIVIGSITTPMLLLAGALLALGAPQIRRRMVIVAIFVMILLVVGLGVRYRGERDYWNANCPGEMTKQ